MAATFLVIGLGRFGTNLALRLMDQGNEVMVLDSSEETVSRIAPHVTQAKVGDCMDEEVLASLASGAVAEVEGVSGLMNVAPKKSGTRGVRLVVDEESAVVDVYILIRYGYAIPEVAGKIQNAVAAALESMTGFAVKAVNVHVGGVSFQ